MPGGIIPLQRATSSRFGGRLRQESARLRSFAYNLIRASGANNIQNARYRAALDFAAVVKLTAKY
jgi:hypothetical protein